MALHRLTIASHRLELKLPINARFTDIEYECGGNGVIPSGCRVGACGACLIRVLSGADTLFPRGIREGVLIEKLGYKGEEYRLACQCRIRGEMVVEVLG